MNLIVEYTFEVRSPGLRDRKGILNMGMPGTSLSWWPIESCFVPWASRQVWLGPYRRVMILSNSILHFGVVIPRASTYSRTNEFDPLS